MGFQDTPKEVTIGKQVWMTQNLNVVKFRNGDPIPEAKTKEEWKLAGENKEPAWCSYKNNPSNSEKIGKLYNWYAVVDPRGLAPEGWKVPSEGDWVQLENFIGYDAAYKIKSLSDWSDGSNESGFSALRSGSRSKDGQFGIIHESHWWSSTGYLVNSAVVYGLLFDSDYIKKEDYRKESGLSVRCIKQ